MYSGSIIRELAAALDETLRVDPVAKDEDRLASERWETVLDTTARIKNNLRAVLVFILVAPIEEFLEESNDHSVRRQGEMRAQHL
jgi:hypothetical protein